MATRQQRKYERFASFLFPERLRFSIVYGRRITNRLGGKHLLKFPFLRMLHLLDNLPSEIEEYGGLEIQRQQDSCSRSQVRDHSTDLQREFQSAERQD